MLRDPTPFGPEREKRFAKLEAPDKVLLNVLGTYLSERQGNARRLEMLRDRVALIGTGGGLGLIAFMLLRPDKLAPGTAALGGAFVLGAGMLAAFAVAKYHERVLGERAAATALRAEINAICIREAGVDVEAIVVQALAEHRARQPLAALETHLIWIGMALAVAAAGLVLMTQ